MSDERRLGKLHNFKRYFFCHLVDIVTTATIENSMKLQTQLAKVVTYASGQLVNWCRCGEILNFSSMIWSDWLETPSVGVCARLHQTHVYDCRIHVLVFSTPQKCFQGETRQMFNCLVFLFFLKTGKVTFKESMVNEVQCLWILSAGMLIKVDRKTSQLVGRVSHIQRRRPNQSRCSCSHTSTNPSH